MKKFIVAVVYTGKSKLLVPSRWYKVEASTKSVAAQRALTKAKADNPRYTAYTATVDTLTARKIKRFNREFSKAQATMQEAEKRVAYWQTRAYAEVDRIINGYGRPRRMRKFIFNTHKAAKEILADNGLYWLQMLELRDVINGKGGVGNA